MLEHLGSDQGMYLKSGYNHNLYRSLSGTHCCIQHTCVIIVAGRPDGTESQGEARGQSLFTAINPVR